MTQPITRAAILAYMRSIVDQATEPATGEVCATALLESAADHFNHDEWNDDEGDAWELAAQLAASRNRR